MNSYAEWSDLLRRYAEILGPVRSSVCTSIVPGSSTGPRASAVTCALIDSDLDLVPLLRAFADQGCGGRILCESPVMEDDALLMKAAWEHIAGR